jgi:hypothetical protein
MRYAQLQGANLGHAKLGGANLDQIDATGADFNERDCPVNQGEDPWTWLVATTLDHAILGRVNFSYANLTGANMKAAILDRADLTCTKLSGADLRNTSLVATRGDPGHCGTKAIGCRDVESMRFADLRGATLARKASTSGDAKLKDIVFWKSCADSQIATGFDLLDVLQLGGTLVKIACDGDPYVAAGIVRRIREDDVDPVLRHMVVKQMVKPDCRSAKKMSRANKDRLISSLPLVYRRSARLVLSDTNGPKH